ncbi:MAG TPA: AAA family ATPase, partial [Candidatus Scalindua sp.]|nr:AAA family ATPase [Candidatus Scalindua sp.]
MQERFLVLGKAGSGKTHLVLQKFLHYVDEHKEDNVIFILPTHSQVGHLRDHILRASEYKGYLDTGLVTFSGLANRILDHVDSSPLWKPINESEKDLVLSSVLRVADTSYFSEVSGYAGFKSAFLDFIREIKENSLVPPAFKDVLKKLQTGKRHSPLNLKCNELVTLYDRYQQTLNKNSFVDKEDLLAQAQLHLNKNLFSKVELLLVDGFHDYTQLELKLLEELTSLVSNVYITLPHHTSGSVSPAFRVSNKTYSQLTVLGLKEMRLDENRRTNRQMLRHIEANIFSQSEETVTLETDSPDTPLQITAAANMQDEVE